MERTRLAFQEWSLAPGARRPGWDIVERFLQGAIGSNQISEIVVFEPAPGAERYATSSHLVGDELRVSGQRRVRSALCSIVAMSDMTISRHANAATSTSALRRLFARRRTERRDGLLRVVIVAPPRTCKAQSA